MRAFLRTVAAVAAIPFMVANADAQEQKPPLKPLPPIGGHTLQPGMHKPDEANPFLQPVVPAKPVEFNPFLQPVAPAAPAEPPPPPEPQVKLKPEIEDYLKALNEQYEPLEEYLAVIRRDGKEIELNEKQGKFLDILRGGIIKPEVYSSVDDYAARPINIRETLKSLNEILTSKPKLANQEMFANVLYLLTFVNENPVFNLPAGLLADRTIADRTTKSIFYMVEFIRQGYIRPEHFNIAVKPVKRIIPHGIRLPANVATKDNLKRAKSAMNLTTALLLDLVLKDLVYREVKTEAEAKAMRERLFKMTATNAIEDLASQIIPNSIQKLK